MDKLLLIMAGYAMLLAVGWRAIKKGGSSKGELLLFVALTSYGMYMSCARMFEWPSGSINTLHYWVFGAIGKWIESMLGGAS
ncbi:hypothetical protein [Cohnella sp. GCM10027633]|uniref:hypothetical protein n=1 Tax=unclassified Cohnella TaxID=2636738 RepID=UPI00363B9E90